MSIDVRMLDSRSFLVDIKSSKVLSIKIDSELLATIDKMWRDLGYTSRSEFIRESLIVVLKLIELVKESNPETISTHGKNEQPLTALYRVIEEIMTKNGAPKQHAGHIDSENQAIVIK